MSIVISAENLSKTYRLGQIGTGTFSLDMEVWWARLRGKPNPLLRIGEKDNAGREGDELWALRDVSFKVAQGEALGIIGRNGAGKSTLLKILSRVTAPTSGKIKVKGRIASLLEVGTGFHPDLTGRENIYLNGAILGMSRHEIQRKFDEIVAFAEVEKFVDTPVKRYSSGMYVRLAFAVAAHLEPEILVVDEVLAVGDAEFQKKCLGKMGDVAREGRTVLFVSHNMAAVQNLCKSCLLIEKGSIKLQDSATAVIQEYFSQYKSKDALIEIHDPEFVLNNFSLSQQDQQSDVFYSHKDILIEFAYELPKVLKGLRVGFDLVSQDGTILWRSFDDDMDGIASRAAGRYVSNCVIPKNLLKAGSYQILLRIGLHNVRWISNEENFITFTVMNTQGTNKTYADKNRPGVLMPLLNWENRMDNEKN